ncbi:MAG TPA: hypothetical protein VJ837_02920 [Candidatus Paceibacterota bacterium]|nr:hypothetical protein [Candidatus Paceibacterota bacterium]
MLQGISHLHGKSVGIQEGPGKDVLIRYGTLVCAADGCQLLRGDATPEATFEASEVIEINDRGETPIIVLDRGVSPEWDRRKVKDGRSHPTA